MNGFFVTGTDTDVGKTLASSILTLALEGCYWKPIASGVPDRETVQQLTELTDAHFHPTQYAFKASLSPDQAAALEATSIDINTCVMPKTNKTLIVEGAGGVYTPLTPQICMLDFMQHLALPVIIVSRGKIGTINHTLLTIEALRHRKIKIHGVIFNGDVYPKSQKTIEEWGSVTTLFHIPYFENLSKPQLHSWINEHKGKIQEALT